MMSFQDNIQLSDFVFEHTSESIMITDANNKIILINSAMEKLTGYTRAELYGKNPSILSSGKQTKVFYQTMWNTLLATNKWKGEIWNKTNAIVTIKLATLCQYLEIYHNGKRTNNN